MKKVAYAGLLTITSLFTIHCAAPPVTGDSLDKGDEEPTTDTQDNTSTSSTTPAPTETKTVPTSVPATTPPAAKAPPPASSPTQTTGPGPGCQQLSTCCSKLTNSLEQIACFLAAGKSNELVCAGSLAVFSCSSLTGSTPQHGPSCSGLTSGALYCGNDGPGGDPDTLYRCSGSTVSIVRQCSNGCQTNLGVDDACMTTTSSSPSSSSGASCVGLSGDYCGTDYVGGSANTLYTCSGNQIVTSKTCANGCVTNPNPAYNDTCATTPPASSSGSVSCAGLPDFDYCGSSVGGDANTLYTCTGGRLTGSSPCASGCTVAASNVSDYCSVPAGAASSSACSGLPNGTYCGYNGPGGDFDTLYTCKNGNVQTNEFCDWGCWAGDFGGDDSCY